MEQISLSFSEKLKINSKDRRLFYDMPDEIEKLFLTIIDAQGEIYINDDTNKQKRVLTQALIKIYQDFSAIKTLLRNGHRIQAATITSSMLETNWFISYIGHKPEKVDIWLTHNEHKWDDNFNNWMTSTLSYWVKSGEITKEFRENIEKTERETYSILSAAKHGNGFSLRKTNVIMEIEGKPYLIREPPYTLFSRGECSYVMGIANKIATQSIKFYLRALHPDRTYVAFKVAESLGEEAMALGLEIQIESQNLISSSQENSKVENLFVKSRNKL